MPTRRASSSTSPGSREQNPFRRANNRALLGDLSRVAARTLTAFIRATTGERALSVGIVASIQTHGSLANWHPHLHLLVTDGGFRPDGSFVPLPLHDVATVTEACRRAVLTMFVQRELMDRDTAQRMLAWPHSGFHVHDGVWVPAEDRAFATRLARSCARHPVALSRLAYRADTGMVTYQSDKPSGPTAGAETVGWTFAGRAGGGSCAISSPSGVWRWRGRVHPRDCPLPRNGLQMGTTPSPRWWRISRRSGRR